MALKTRTWNFFLLKLLKNVQTMHKKRLLTPKGAIPTSSKNPAIKAKNMVLISLSSRESITSRESTSIGFTENIKGKPEGSPSSTKKSANSLSKKKRGIFQKFLCRKSGKEERKKEEGEKKVQKGKNTKDILRPL